MELVIRSENHSVPLTLRRRRSKNAKCEGKNKGKRSTQKF